MTNAHPGDGRRLIVADLENLTGCDPQSATHSHYAFAVRELCDRTKYEPERDRMIIGVNPHLAFTAHDLCPPARVTTMSGQDGADRRLCYELEDTDFIRRRFSTVIVASGDGRFLDPVVALNHYGLTTVVASLPGQLATRLRLAAQHVVWLRQPPLPGTATGEAA